MSDGSMMILFSRPISLTFLVLTGASLLLPVLVLRKKGIEGAEED
jgi:TctA family transporter